MMPDACPLCEEAPCSTLFFKDEHEIFRCSECQLVFSTNEPQPDDLPVLYGRDYFTAGGSGYRSYVGEEPTHRLQARRYLRRLARFTPPGRVLDIGCAAGYFLDEARRAGWDARGLDASPYASTYAGSRLKLNVVTGGFLDVDLDDGFDLITLFNVLEHMADPVNVERRLYDLVRPGGFVAIETWDCDSLMARLFGSRWQQYDPDYVPYYYSPRSLARLFPAERWTLRSLRRAVKWISLKRGFEIVADRGGIARSMLHRMAGSPLGRLRLPYVTGELLFTILERRPSSKERSIEGAN